MLLDSNVISYLKVLFVVGVTAPQWVRASSFTRFLDHTTMHHSW